MPEHSGDNNLNFQEILDELDAQAMEYTLDRLGAKFKKDQTLPSAIIRRPDYQALEWKGEDSSCQVLPHCLLTWAKLRKAFEETGKPIGDLGASYSTLATEGVLQGVPIVPVDLMQPYRENQLAYASHVESEMSLLRQVYTHRGIPSDILRKFITENLVYPTEALKYQREGMTVVNFQISKNGNVQNVKCIRDMGLGTGQAAIDVIEKMQKTGVLWNPGYEDGEAKIVSYIFPISFTLPSQQEVP